MYKKCKNCKYYIQRKKPMTCTYDERGYCEKDDYNVVSENYTCKKFIEKSNSEKNHD